MMYDSVRVPPSLATQLPLGSEVRRHRLPGLDRWLLISTLSDKEVCELHVDRDNTIMFVNTKVPYRRSGYATFLLNVARSYGEVFHDYPEYCGEWGLQWAMATGGDMRSPMADYAKQLARHVDTVETA